MTGISILIARNIESRIVLGRKLLKCYLNKRSKQISYRLCNKITIEKNIPRDRYLITTHEIFNFLWFKILNVCTNFWYSKKLGKDIFYKSAYQEIIHI